MTVEPNTLGDERDAARHPWRITFEHDGKTWHAVGGTYVAQPTRGAGSGETGRTLRVQLGRERYEREPNRCPDPLVPVVVNRIEVGVDLELREYQHRDDPAHWSTRVSTWRVDQERPYDRREPTQAARQVLCDAARVAAEMLKNHAPAWHAAEVYTRRRELEIVAGELETLRARADVLTAELAELEK